MIAKILIFSGIILIVCGVLWHFGLLGWLGKLPGDIRIEKENFKFYFPLTTCVLLSLLVSLIFKIIQWLQR